MSKYRFEEIAFNSTEKKKPEPRDKDTYIALEHLDSGCFEVTRFGTDEAPAGDKLIIHKGDVLFGKRRAYQKKVAIAPFDGIFSAHGMVLRPKENIITKEFFPLFIASDYFLDEAIRISVGSLSPTINWRDLAILEFNLPDISTQRKLAELLWAMERTKTAYKNLIFQTDELVKSQFIEMFGSPVTLDKGWPIMTIDEVATSQLGKMLNAKNQTGQNLHYYLANRNIQWFGFDFSDLRMMDFDEKDCHKFGLQDNDLLVCEGGEIGRCAIWHNEIDDCYMQNAVHRVRCNEQLVTPVFLGHVLYYHAQENGFSDIIGVKVTIPHLPADKLKAMKIMVPPIENQREFEKFVEQSDKSKFVVQQALADLTASQKALMRQNLG